MTLDPARVFATLERHGVDYVTIGAFAVIAHGYVRATADIDLVARQDRERWRPPLRDSERPSEQGTAVALNAPSRRSPRSAAYPDCPRKSRLDVVC